MKRIIVLVCALVGCLAWAICANNWFWPLVLCLVLAVKLSEIDPRGGHDVTPE